ncbi:RagB/SusD family nutrient uptake outer membrane protein [Echinicola sp. 20G]|uniref:RagB/SusD family nutrient uptake outer membrane protein n=1 Tax=Echinicola sp. 20G TaxID=2781961 RepID=UPI00191047CC|nr:RagB/SusD family nutrient uptake outer membrane protein [Echinicola sp. 20G]
MKVIKIYFLIVSVLLLGACGEYLDVTPDNVGTIDYAFRNRNEAENYLFVCYSTMQQMAGPARNAGFTASGEIIYPTNLTTIQIDDITGFNLIRGTQSAGSPGLNYWDGENYGLAIFKALRRCNLMLENIDKPADLSPSEKNRWIAEINFLKAVYHFYLMRMYGPIPIIDSNLPINSSTEEVRVKRAPVDDVVEYIVGLLDKAAQDLPSSIVRESTELGRATSTIALALKAEVLTLAASPLFNGNPDYVSFRDKEGQALFPSEYDENKWKLAADACLEAIEISESNGGKLYSFNAPGTIGQLSDSLYRVLTIQNAVTEEWDENPELVWALNGYFPYQGFATPRMTSQSVINAFSNPSTFSVPIEMQEIFYTSNGVPINEDKTWDYEGRYSNMVNGDKENRFYIKEGYTTISAHFDREPRFYASVAFDGGIWFGNGVLDQNKAYHVEARGNSSKAGPKDLIRLNVTGYWPKKLVHYQSVYDDGFQQVNFRLPLIRLSGLYLLYAEALNEYQGPTEEVYHYVNLVRERAGLPAVQDAWSSFSKFPDKFTTKEGMRSIIHQERRIELCFEGQVGWDLRRWKELQDVLSKPLRGWSIYDKDPVNYYQPITRVNPVFGLKDYLWPIKSDNLVRNPNLVQTPYW